MSRIWSRPQARFASTMLFGGAWTAAALWLDAAWAHDLGQVISPPLAWLVIGGIALFPGYLNSQLFAALLVAPNAPVDPPGACPDLTVIVAVYNEQDSIARTVDGVLRQEYPAHLRVIVVDDGSSDDTPQIVRALARSDGRVDVVRVSHRGKAGALNAGLAACTTELVATVDADTELAPAALLRLVGRLLLSPPTTVAVAGSVQVRNRRASLLARMQHFDYYLAIASIKRQQGLLRATLVAQGAFSLYRAGAIRAAGGWPDLLGEDIVLTWAMLRDRGQTTFEPTAVAYTDVPPRLSGYIRQRRRWSRGMIEGLQRHGIALLSQRRMLSHSVANNLLMPYLDFAYSLAIPIGVVAALRGDYLLVGPLTLAVMPVNLLVVATMRASQRRSYDSAELEHPDADRLGFACFFLLYQLIASPAACSGYVAEALGLSKRW